MDVTRAGAPGRLLLAALALLTLALPARADLINPGDRCIHTRATFANLTAFPGYRFALVDIQFVRPGEPPPGPTGVRLLDEGAALDPEPSLMPLRELMALPAGLNHQGLSMQALVDAGALRSNVAYQKMSVCFPQAEPGDLEVRDYRVEHVDSRGVGARLARVARLDGQGNVVATYRLLPQARVIDPPPGPGPGPRLVLVTGQAEAARAREIAQETPFEIPPWPPSLVFVGAPLPAAGGLAGWMQEHRDKATQWPLDGLEVAVLPEQSPVRRVVLHYRLDLGENRPPRLARMPQDGEDASGAVYWVSWGRTTKMDRQPLPRGWIAAVALGLMAAGAAALASRSRKK